MGLVRRWLKFLLDDYKWVCEIAGVVICITNIPDYQLRNVGSGISRSW